MEKVLNLLKNIFLLHNKNSELMDVRRFNVTPVSYFVKVEPLEDENFCEVSNYTFDVFVRLSVCL
jgi:hypothetical protein